MKPPFNHGIGSLEDEKAYYDRKGRSWTAGQLPDGGNTGYSTPIGSTNVHQDMESDPVWDNLIMYWRTGITAYLNRAVAWGNYFNTSYLADLETYDHSMLYDHIFGWGLVHLSRETGDPSYAETAQDILDVVKTFFTTEASDNTKSGYHGGRINFRWLRLAVELGDLSFAGDVWNGLVNGSGAVPSSYDSEYKVWLTANGGLGNSAVPLLYLFPMFDGMIAYYDAIPAGAAKDQVAARIIGLADFCIAHQLFTDAGEPLRNQYSPSTIWINATGYPAVYYPGFSDATATVVTYTPTYTSLSINGCVKAYWLTGNSAYLAFAELCWQRYSGVSSWDTGARVPDNEVGWFMGTLPMQGGGLFYLGDAEPHSQFMLFQATSHLAETIATASEGVFTLVTARGDSGFDSTLLHSQAGGNQAMLSFCRRAHYDERNSWIFATVGAHDGDSQTLRYKIPTNAWDKKGPWGWQVRAEGQARHTYDWLAFDHDTRLQFAAPMASLNLYKISIDSIDDGSPSWTTMPNHTSQSGFYGTSNWFPDYVDGPRLVIPVWGGIKLYNPSTDAMTVLVSEGTYDFGYYCISRYNPATRQIMIFGGFVRDTEPIELGTTVYLLNADGSVTTKGQIPAYIHGATGYNDAVMEVDPVSGDYIVLVDDLPGAGTGTAWRLARYNSVSDVWTRMDTAGGGDITVPTGWTTTAYDTGNVLTARLDAPYNSILFISGASSGGAGVYVLKLSPQFASDPPDPPALPPAVTKRFRFWRAN